MIQTIVINTLKLVLGVLTNEEKDELRTVTRIRHAGPYLKLYIEEVENDRDSVAYLVLRDHLYNNYL